jgi:hypothetical protein
MTSQNVTNTHIRLLPTAPVDIRRPAHKEKKEEEIMKEFESPASKDSLRPGDLLGHLVAFEVNGFKPLFETTFGPKDAVELTIHDIDTESTYPGVLWFSTAIVSALKPKVDSVVLARIGQGEGRHGQQPPWILKDASADLESVRKANAYLGDAV